ncbi:phage minor head protein [Fuchsiella alkaliacetigena]|uniref:phage minor head protein n=1 Tax=Fuchsiella alkaliacetigena TaxID=957042 RepID=UPI00200B9F87|nr:phage minor head protein [Fuchsiella alkaliacetigena]MCK8824722.1 minor capsid protein [Fuchsiella alkaliacetigena]
MPTEFVIKSIEERLKEEERAQKYVKLLEGTLKRIDRDLLEMFPKASEDGSWSKSKLHKYNRKQKLKEQIEAEIKKYAQDFKKELRDGLAQGYKQQSLFVQETISKATDQSFSRLPVQSIKTVAIDQAEIAGKTLTEYISKYSTDLAHRIQTEVFQGIALGENPERVAKRLAQAGKMGEARAKTTFRSWYNKILNSANFDTYEQSSVEKVIYDATLDTRTTMICASRDGNIYTLEEIRDMLPAHHN